MCKHWSELGLAVIVLRMLFWFEAGFALEGGRGGQPDLIVEGLEALPFLGIVLHIKIKAEWEWVMGVYGDFIIYGECEE